jgi:hypothetical protein
MGNSKSKNIVESVTNTLLEVVNETTQTCSQAVNMNQIISVKGKNVNITGSTISQNQVFDVNFSCLQDAKTVNNLQSSLDQKAQQLAASTNQALNLNPGSTSSKNITNYITNIKESILNAYTGECSNAVDAMQRIDIEAKDNVNINNATLDQDQAGKLITTCIQKSEAYNQAVSNVQQAVDQSAQSTVQPLINTNFIWIIAAIIAIIIIIAIVAFLIILFSGRKKSS